MKRKTLIRLRTKRKDLDEPLLDLLKNVFDASSGESDTSDDMLDKRIRDLTGDPEASFDEASVKRMLDAIFGDDDDLEMSELYGDIDDGDDATEIISEGRFISDNDGNIEISYDESEISGMAGTVCRIVFNKRSPGLVSMIREGSVNTMLSFEEGKRHKSAYNTPYMPFQLAINTLEVDNRLLEDGELYLNYVIEISGLGSERCTVELKIGDMSDTTE